MICSKNHFRANDGVRAIIIALLFGQIIRLAKGGRNHANLSSWLHEHLPLTGFGLRWGGEAHME